MRVLIAVALSLAAATPVAAQLYLGHGSMVAERQDSQDDTREFGFGQSVLRYDDQLIVGASGFYTPTGDVIFHRRVDGRWTEFQRLTPSLPADIMKLGHALVRVGDYVVVGAPSSTVAGMRAAGAIQILAYDAAEGQWTVTATVTEPTPAEAAYFGSALAVDGTRLYVAAPYAGLGGFNDPSSEAGESGGRVYAFEVGDDVTFVETLQGQFDIGGAAFGQALATAPARLVVGAPGEGTPSRTGAIYHFDTGGGVATLVERVENDSADARRGAFGRALSIAGGRLLVGAATFAYDDPNRPGAATVFEFTPDGLERLATLEAPGDRFGWSVLLLSAQQALVGAPGDGLVYHFMAEGEEWTAVQRLAEPVQSTFGTAAFGETMTLAEGELFIGNPSTLHDMGLIPSFSKGGNLYEVPLLAPPLADLSLTVAAPVDVVENTTASAEFTVTGDASTGVGAAYLDIVVELTVMSTPPGCRTLRPEVIRCELGALAAGEERSLQFDFRIPPVPPMISTSFEAYAGSELADSDTVGNAARHRFHVAMVPSPTEPAPSGGGSFGWLGALFLLAMLKSRIRLRRSASCSARTCGLPVSIPNSR